MNVIIIDDDLDVTSNMYRMFTLLTVNAIVINTYENYLLLNDDILKGIDIFILDYNFSLINGVELIKKIKKRLLHKNPIFIIYTGDLSQIKKDEIDFLIKNKVLQIEKPNIKSITKIVKELK